MLLWIPWMCTSPSEPKDKHTYSKYHLNTHTVALRLVFKPIASSEILPEVSLHWKRDIGLSYQMKCLWSICTKKIYLFSSQFAARSDLFSSQFVADVAWTCQRKVHFGVWHDVTTSNLIDPIADIAVIVAIATWVASAHSSHVGHVPVDLS